MIADVYTGRRAGFKIPESERTTPTRGTIALESVWVTETRTKPAMVLHVLNGGGLRNVKAILYEPELVALGGDVVRFKGWELIDYPGQGKQAVIQEWRCVLNPNGAAP